MRKINLEFRQAVKFVPSSNSSQAMPVVSCDPSLRGPVSTPPVCQPDRTHCLLGNVSASHATTTWHEVQCAKVRIQIRHLSSSYWAISSLISPRCKSVECKLVEYRYEFVRRHSSQGRLLAS